MRVIATWLMGAGLVLSSGCSMCASGYLDDYATVGGKWQRGNPTSGRVGSIFSEAGGTVSASAINVHDIGPHSSGIEGEVFGEATTEGYPEAVEEFQELEISPSSNGYYDAGDVDGELILGDQW